MNIYYKYIIIFILACLIVYLFFLEKKSDTEKFEGEYSKNKNQLYVDPSSDPSLGKSNDPSLGDPSSGKSNDPSSGDPLSGKNNDPSSGDPLSGKSNDPSSGDPSSGKNNDPMNNTSNTQNLKKIIRKFDKEFQKVFSDIKTEVNIYEGQETIKLNSTTDRFNEIDTSHTHGKYIITKLQEKNISLLKTGVKSVDGDPTKTSDEKLINYNAEDKEAATDAILEAIKNLNNKQIGDFSDTVRSVNAENPSLDDLKKMNKALEKIDKESAISSEIKTKLFKKKKKIILKK